MEAFDTRWLPALLIAAGLTALGCGSDDKEEPEQSATASLVVDAGGG